MRKAAWVTGLLLNPKKCAIVFPVGLEKAEIVTMFQGVGPNVSLFQVGTSARYLGMFLGPGGPERSWIGPLRKLKSRLQYIRGLALGLTQNIYAYKTFGFPLLSFPAQFLPAPAAVLRAERDAHQFLTAGPRWAVPSFVLAHTDEI
eukprot:8384940-Pyramimonas_sp.AAC.1